MSKPGVVRVELGVDTLDILSKYMMEEDGLMSLRKKGEKLLGQRAHMEALHIY